MSRSLAKLDKSSWTPEQLARSASFDEAQRKHREYLRREQSHYLYGTLDGVGDDSLNRSEAPQAKLIARDFGNGHSEACVMIVHPSLQDTLENAIRRDCRAPRGQGDREASRAASERRARQQVRHTCKAMLVNALWTLTYKANQTDREVTLRHLDRFRRKMAELFGEWRYIAVLEQQARGAWHVHIATHALPFRMSFDGFVGKVKSWDVMRAVWRRIVGDLGGNFDESKRKRRWGGPHKPIRGADSIAAYIAGYVAKDMQQSELNRKRYSCSKGVDIPKAYREVWRDELPPFAELIELAFSRVGQNITRAWFDRERQVFFVAADDSLTVGSGPS